jgi:branched-chain amino acid transport system permease protein
MEESTARIKSTGRTWQVMNAKNIRLAVVLIGCLIMTVAIGISGGPAQIVNVLVTGGMWALLSVGLALVMGVMNIPYFAHGESFMIGAYAAYFAFDAMSRYLHQHPNAYLAAIAPLIAMLGAAVAGFIIGLVIERLVFAPLRHKSKAGWVVNALLLTVGISFILTNGTTLMLGPDYRGVARYWDIAPVQLFGMRLPLERLVALAIAMLSIAVLWLILLRTDFGRQVRAVSQDEMGAEMVGIDLDRIQSLTFALSTSLAALAGGALLFMFQAYPTVGQKPLFFAWFVVMLVGMGNIAGAVIGGFIVALLQTTTQQFIGITWDSVVPTALMILVLLIAPSGIFGSEVKGIHEE